ncbi:MAG TPA: phage major capsid protein [Rhizomicrobium sp.]
MPAIRTTEEIVAAIDTEFAKFSAALKDNSAALEANGASMAQLQSRMLGVEQAIAAANRGSGGGMFTPRSSTWGAQVLEHERFKSFLANGHSGKVSLNIKAEITVPSGTEQRDLVMPQRDGIAPLGQQLLTVRDLLTVIPTTSNKIDFLQQTSRDLRAAGVADGAEKPESDIGLALKESSVRTIAHWVGCPKQSLDDLPELSALIDSELVFGLRREEEAQILAGDGTDQNLLGIIPQALPFSAPFVVADENPLDRILLGILQAAQARLPIDAVVVNDLTWGQLISLKDGEQRYLSGSGGGPFGSIGNQLWQVRAIPTPGMERGTALCGAFKMGARIHDRQTPTVEISTEDRDNFIKNMVTIRAEERLALTVRQPDSFVYIDQLGDGLSG